MKTFNQEAAQGNKFDDSTPSSHTNQSPESCINDDTSIMPMQTVGQSGLVFDNSWWRMGSITVLRIVQLCRGAL